jgi:ribonuclease HI
MVAKKLKHYFEEHPITMVSTTPLLEIIGCKDASGRVAKWAIELAAHTIQYKPRTTIKSQIITDFFADWGEHQYLPPAPNSSHWRMHFDSFKILGGLGAGVILTSPKGDKLRYVLQMHFHASNNVTKYETLVHGLKMAKEIGIRRILCFGDSELVVHQVSGEWDTKDANMASNRFYVQQLSGFFEGYEFHHVPRANNDEVDRLSKIGSTRQDIPAGVSLEIIRKPSIKPSPESVSIYVPRDLAPAQVPPPDPGAAASGLKASPARPARRKTRGLPAPCRLSQPANRMKPA